MPPWMQSWNKIFSGLQYASEAWMQLIQNWQQLEHDYGYTSLVRTSFYPFLHSYLFSLDALVKAWTSSGFYQRPNLTPLSSVTLPQALPVTSSLGGWVATCLHAHMLTMSGLSLALETIQLKSASFKSQERMDGLASCLFSWSGDTQSAPETQPSGIWPSLTSTGSPIGSLTQSGTGPALRTSQLSKGGYYLYVPVISPCICVFTIVSLAGCTQWQVLMKKGATESDPRSDPPSIKYELPCTLWLCCIFTVSDMP